MNRILLQDLLLYDGTGSSPFRADLLLEGDRILQLEKASCTVFSCVEKRSYRECAVSPGWIDIHAHSDASILADPQACSKITQGITCEISGNCGLSAFPILSGEVREHLKELYKVYDLKLDWTDFRSYADAADRVSPAVNCVFLCGHNTLRAAVMGYRDRSLSPGDLETMCGELHKALLQGAAGISTGLLYTPGCFAGKEELLALLQVTAGHGKFHAAHLRNEGDHLEEALEEALSLSRQSTCPLQISHLKTALERNWHKLPSVLKKIRNAQADGLSVHADRYPYTYSQTSLSIVLPEPFDTMTDLAIRETLRKDPLLFRETLERLRETKRDWNKVILTSTQAEQYAHFTGSCIAEAAQRSNRDPEEWVMDLLREDSPSAMAAFSGLSEENLKTILQQEFLCCGSDETARGRDYSLGRSHPRGFGSMVRFIRMCRDQRIPMEQIISRITALPAKICSIRDRGILAPGMKADLTIFREADLMDHADFITPHAPCSGIEEVYINGIAHSSGVRAGKVLRIPSEL